MKISMRAWCGAMLGMTLSCMTSHALAEKLFVDNSDQPSCDNGFGDPFCDIQAAIDRAEPGDTIEVAPGVYLGSLVVDVDNLTLRGFNATVLAPEADIVVDVTADDVTIESLRILGGNTGVRARRVRNTTLSLNIIREQDRVGINMTGPGHVVDSNTIFRTKRHGMRLGRDLDQTDGITITNNEFVQNGFDDPPREMNDNALWTGIVVLNARDVTIKDNLFQKQKGSRAVDGAAIHVRSSTIGIRIEDNEFQDNENAIVVSGDSTANRIEGNTIDGDGVCGIDLTGSGFNVVTDNVIENQSIGMIVSSSGNIISGSRVRYAGAAGYRVSGNDNVLAGNKATSGRKNGFFDEGSRNVYRNNLANKNALNGYASPDASEQVLDDNRARRNGSNGFVIGSDSDAVDNTAEENDSNGFKITGTANDLTDNVATDNDGFGYRETGAANTYTTNTCTGNISGGSDPGGLCTP